MDIGAVLTEINKGNLQAIYVLHGEESFFIDQVARAVVEVVPPETRDFNLHILYGGEVKVGQVVDICRQFPMMGQRQVVVLKEAQQMRDLDGLLEYAEKPQPQTTLVVCHKKKSLDKRKKLTQVLAKTARLVESKPLYENQVPDFIEAQIRAGGRKAQKTVAHLMAVHLGTDLERIHNELQKLFLNIPEGAVITDDHVREHIGIHRDYNMFELTRALSYGERDRALRILSYFAQNARDYPFPMLSGILYSYFQKVFRAHYVRPPDAGNMARQLQIAPFMVREYQMALKHFSPQRAAAILMHLAEEDAGSKGYAGDRKGHRERIQEFMAFLLIP